MITAFKPSPKLNPPLAHISERAQSIPVAMDTLTKVMDANQHQIDELTRHLEAFEQIRDKAVEAVPEIREQVDMAAAWMMFRFQNGLGLQATDGVLSTRLESNWDADTFL